MAVWGAPVADPQPALDQLGAAAFIDAVHPTEAGHRALRQYLDHMEAIIKHARTRR